MCFPIAQDPSWGEIYQKSVPKKIEKGSLSSFFPILCRKFTDKLTNLSLYIASFVDFYFSL